MVTEKIKVPPVCHTQLLPSSPMHGKDVPRSNNSRTPYVSATVLGAIISGADQQKAIDGLICEPPKTAGEDLQDRLLAAGESAKIRLGDAAVAENRSAASAGHTAIRFVRDGSYRGFGCDPALSRGIVEWFVAQGLAARLTRRASVR